MDGEETSIIYLALKFVMSGMSWNTDLLSSSPLCPPPSSWSPRLSLSWEMVRSEADDLSDAAEKRPGVGGLSPSSACRYDDTRGLTLCEGGWRRSSMLASWLEPFGSVTAVKLMACQNLLMTSCNIASNTLKVEVVRISNLWAWWK